LVFVVAGISGLLDFNCHVVEFVETMAAVTVVAVFVDDGGGGDGDRGFTAEN
jgi:hypothetical protein